MAARRAGNRPAGGRVCCDRAAADALRPAIAGALQPAMLGSALAVTGKLSRA